MGKRMRTLPQSHRRQQLRNPKRQVRFLSRRTAYSGRTYARVAATEPKEKTPIARRLRVARRETIEQWAYIAVSTHQTHMPVRVENAQKTPQEIIECLQSDGLPIAVIAEMMQVQRKSVYAWLDGGQINPPNEERLLCIDRLLNYPKSFKLKQLYRMWNREIDGTTLRTLFKDDQLDQERINQMIQKLEPVAQKYQDQENQRSTKSNASRSREPNERPEAFIPSE